MGLVSALHPPEEAEEKVRALAERLAAGPRAGHRRDQALRPRGRPAAARRGARARGRADRGAVPLAGRRGGPHGVRGEAQAGVRGRMSTSTDVAQPAERVERGVVHRRGRRAARGRGDARHREPRHRRARRARDERRPRGRRPRGPRRARRLPRVGAAGLLRPRRDPAGLRGGVRGARRRARARCSSPSRARRCARPAIELHKAADTLAHYAGMQKEVRGVSVHGLDPGVDGRVIRRPLGVVAAIVPWNFPTTLLCNKLGPAFLCGNTVVAKPADTTPLTTLRLAEILARGGPPAGRLQRRDRAAAASLGEALVDPSARAQGRLHRLHAGRRARGGARRGRLQARDARARRLGPDDHLRRRRPRRGGERGEHGPLLQLRPGVPGDQARVRLRVRGRRGGRRDRREGGAAAGRHRQRPGAARWARCTRRASARSSSARSPRAAGEVAGRRRPPGRPGARARLVPRADRRASSRRTTRRMAREEVFGPALPIWRVQDMDEALRARQRLAVRARLVGVDAQPGPRRARRGRARLRLHVDQLAHEGLRRAAVRRPRSPAATARSTARRRFDFYTDKKAVVVKRAG